MKVLRVTIPALLALAPLDAQQPAAGTLPLNSICIREATAGSPTERTLLIVGTLSSRAASTTLRPMSPPELDSLYVGSRKVAGVVQERHCGNPATSLWSHAWYSASAPRAEADGAVWQGRGVTTSLTAGFNFKRGPLAVMVQPLAVFSENRAFAPRPIGQRTPADFRDPAWGAEIDLPFRFGTGAYASVDPGESYVRLESHGVSGGLTTQSQQWGPAYYYPLVLGTESAGFPRGFLETQRLPVGIGDVNAVWEVGVLEASRFSGLAAGARSRVASAFSASFRPAGLRWLELGGGRFFHVRRTQGSLDLNTATLPFTGLLKSQSADVVVGGFNQVASMFFRVAPMEAQLEAYGEFYRDDHSANLRDLAGEPDHLSAFMLGVRRAWERGDEVRALTIEHSNGRLSHLTRVRAEEPIYLHSTITEGHSFRGQPLGSSALIGGGGTIVAWNAIGARRSRDISVELRNGPQSVEGGTWAGEQSGTWLFRFGEHRLLRGKTYGAFVELGVGYGLDNRTNFTLGFSRAD